MVTLRLLALKTRKNIASRPGTSGRLRRDCSPPGGSILTTSAPSQPRNCVHVVPASNWVRSRILIPLRARSVFMASSIAHVTETRAGCALDAGAIPAPLRDIVPVVPRGLARLRVHLGLVHPRESARLHEHLAVDDDRVHVASVAR